jgi:hypothetical protein
MAMMTGGGSSIIIRCTVDEEDMKTSLITLDVARKKMRDFAIG